jgi:hypothetical protein
MPARDSIHAAVVNALVKDGWEITDDPLYLEFGNRHLFIDIGAEDSALVSLEREGVRIAIEIKTLAGPSPMLALEHAVGQFVLYNLMLEEVDSGRQLYLAVPDSTYATLLQEPLGALVVERLPLPIVAVNCAREEVVEWSPPPIPTF